HPGLYTLVVFLMALLQRSRIIATCDECRLPFDPVRGGVCPRCRRLLCGTHYYGSILSRLQGMLGMVPLCPRCRATRDTGATPDAGDAGEAPSAGGSRRG
ncbi:MAG TPA: hypothetical protein VFX39_10625, partial [Gemmatimonadaceae bacterium]|nr:hypothetical protein [Gemmatimonadaceae bacterium]